MRNGAGQEESVERKRCVRFFLFARHIQCLYKNQTDNAQNNRNRKDDGVAERFVQEHAGHRARRECQIYADAEVADAFSAAACGQGVDRDRVARRARNSEEQTMRKSHRGKNRQYADRLVAQEACGKRKERPEVQGLAGESIYEESGEGPAGKRADCIKRNNESGGRIVGRKFFDNVERKNRQQLVKAKEQQKVRGGDRHEIPRPQRRFFCCQNISWHNPSSI